MQQLVGPPNTFAGGRLGEGGGGERPHETLIEADPLRLTIRWPHWELSDSEGRNACQGMGAYSPIPTLSTGNACRPAYLGPLCSSGWTNYPIW